MVVRLRAAAALGQLGQNRPDSTDEWALGKLKDNLSVWRKTAGLVLANREKLDPQIVEKVRTLRNDSRPWVRMAAWDALIEIQGVREAREKAAKEKPQTSAGQP